MNADRWPSDEWHHDVHWHGQIQRGTDTSGPTLATPDTPLTLSTPYAVAAWLTEQIKHSPVDREVQSNTGDGWIPVGDGRAREIAQTHLLAAAQGMSISLRIIATPGAYSVVAQAISAARCDIRCITVRTATPVQPSPSRSSSAEPAGTQRDRHRQ